MKGLLLELFYLKHKYTFLLFLLFPLFLKAQKIKVVDSNNNPIEGVIIHSDDKKTSGLSDKNGIFIFNEKSTISHLNFLLIGYHPKRESVKKIFKNKGKVVLKIDDQLLKEVIIVGRNEQFLQDLIPETDIISQREIQVTNSKSTADALMMSGNVFVQKSQFGGGSPVLRGFEANRVLLVMDGIRMNNAIYRNGHLQNAITVDNFALKRMEVVFGPGSLTYGSDAIGGVIHFKTKEPVFNIKYIDYKARYSSAANEKTGFVGINYGLKKFASLSIVSLSDYGDLRSGSNRPEKYSDFGKRESYVKTIENIDIIQDNSDPNIQVGTGYSQFNFLNKSIFNFSNTTELTSNIQYSTSSDVPRYDFLTEKSLNSYKYAEWFYGPQTRFLGSLRLDLSNVNLLYDNAVFILALQKINEDRNFRKFGDEWSSSNLERLVVFSLSTDIKKYINHNRNHELVYGFDFQNNDLNSSAERKNINTGEIIKDILSRYPSGSAQNYRMGAYVQYIYGELDKPFLYSLGTRAENNNILVRYENNNIIDWPESYYNGIENNNISYAFSTGLKYKFGKNLIISTNLSTAFRNPNIDDLSKIRAKKGEILIPNLDLKTENSINAELSLNKELNIKNINVKFRTTGFYTILNNAIIRKDFVLPSGTDIYIDGDDTLQVMANQNAEKEKVYGFSVGLNTKYNKFSLSSNLVYTKGDLFEDGVKTGPAPHIPPIFGNVKLGYSQEELRIDFITVFNGSKPIDLYGGSTDNPELATMDGTYSWTTFNLYIEYKLNKYLNFNLGLENILDTHYRTFSSGVSGSGRNFIIGFSGKI